MREPETGGDGTRRRERGERPNPDDLPDMRTGRAAEPDPAYEGTGGGGRRVQGEGLLDPSDAPLPGGPEDGTEPSWTEDPAGGPIDENPDTGPDRQGTEEWI